MNQKTDERLLLSGLFQHGKNAFIEVSDITKSSHFGVADNRIIWEVIEYIYKNTQLEQLSPELIMSNCVNIGLTDYFANDHIKQKYLRALANTPLAFNNLLPLAKKLGRINLIHEGVKKLDDAKNALMLMTGDEKASEILVAVEKPVLDFSLDLRGLEKNIQPVSLSNSLRERFEYLSENIVDQVGLPTGFPEFDYAIGGGLRRQSVTLVAARRGRGKSFFSLNVSAHVAINLGIPCLYLYNEMSEDEQLDRLMAIHSGAPLPLIETGQFSENDHLVNKVQKTVSDIENAPMYIHDMSGLSIDGIFSLMKRWIIKDVGFEGGRTKPCLIIYDYLSLPEAEQRKNNTPEWQAMGTFARSLVNFATEYYCPILALTQLNKDGDVYQADRVTHPVSCVVHLMDIEDEDKQLIPDDMSDVVNRKFFFSKRRHAKDTTYSYNNPLCLSFHDSCGRMTEVGGLQQLKAIKNFTVDADVPFSSRTAMPEYETDSEIT